MILKIQNVNKGTDKCEKTVDNNVNKELRYVSKQLITM